jgi:hypothetical protein
MELQVTRIEGCFIWLQNEFDSTDEFATQSVDGLISKLNLLCNVLPFVNGQMALAKKKWNEAKVKAYYDLIASSTANEKYFAPSLGKDFVNAKCSNEQYAYDVAERCSRTLVHLIDALRSAISALKEENITQRYTNNVV